MQSCSFILLFIAACCLFTVNEGSINASTTTESDATNTQTTVTSHATDSAKGLPTITVKTNNMTANQTDPKSKPEKKEPNFAVNLIVQPLTMATCFLVALVLKY